VNSYLYRFDFRQSKRDNVAAIAAAGHVLKHYLSLDFRQRALGEGRKHVRIRMTDGGRWGP
jgi:hypothetical protein